MLILDNYNKHLIEKGSYTQCKVYNLGHMYNYVKSSYIILVILVIPYCNY